MTDGSHDQAFFEHPDVQALQGPEGIFNPGFASAKDLLRGAPELASLDAAPVGSELRLVCVDDQGEREEVSFKRSGIDSSEHPNPLEWELLHKMPNGDSVGEPAFIDGSSLDGRRAMVVPGKVLKGTRVPYTVVHTMTVRTAAELPPTAPPVSLAHTLTVEEEAKRHVPGFKPFDIEDAIRRGLVVRDESDSSLRWVLPVSQQTFKTGYVSEARIALPAEIEAERRAAQGKEPLRVEEPTASRVGATAIKTYGIPTVESLPRQRGTKKSVGSGSVNVSGYGRLPVEAKHTHGTVVRMPGGQRAIARH